MVPKKAILPTSWLGSLLGKDMLKLKKDGSSRKNLGLAGAGGGVA